MNIYGSALAALCLNHFPRRTAVDASCSESRLKQKQLAAKAGAAKAVPANAAVLNICLAALAVLYLINFCQKEWWKKKSFFFLGFWLKRLLSLGLLSFGCWQCVRKPVKINFFLWIYMVQPWLPYVWIIIPEEQQQMLLAAKAAWSRNSLQRKQEQRKQYQRTQQFWIYASVLYLINFCQIYA